jgi:hypothetical protein
MVISILIREAFYFSVPKQMENGQFHKTCKDQLVQRVQVEVTERMAATERTDLMERQ